MSKSTVHTFCRVCEPACGLLAEVDEGQVVALSSDIDHPTHRGFSCHKGIQYLRIHRDPDRLDHPLRRRSGRAVEKGDFERVTWDEAATEIGSKLNDIVRRHGDKAIAMYIGNPHALNSTLFTNEQDLMASFGEGPRFGAFTVDCANKLAGSEAIYGSFMVHPIPDLVYTDYFLSLGGNPAVSHMAIMEVSDPMAKLRAIKERGGKSVFVNPRHIESATPGTGELVLIKPDTDFYFLAGMLHEIVFHVGFDEQHARQHGSNLDELIEFVSKWPAERATAVTGVSLETIRRIAREFCTAPTASINMSTGVNMGKDGLLSYWLVQMISLLSGNLGKRGGNFYAPGISPTAHLAKRQDDDPFLETEFGQMRAIAGQLPSNMMADILSSERNPIKALIVVSGNPLLSVGGEDRLRAALQRLELIVSVDIYRSATAELADYVLPAKDFLEREDVNIIGNGQQLEPHIQYTPAVVPAKADRRDDWWILSRLLQAMGRPSLLDDPQPKPFGAIEAMLQYRDLSLEKLKGLPCQTAELPEPDRADTFRFGVHNDDGLIDCCPPVIMRAFPSAEEHWQELRGEPEDQLKLITRRSGLTVNSWMHNLAVHKKGVHTTNPLWMNSHDAQSRGLYPGVEVVVRSDFGQVRADLVLDDTLGPGVVAMSHGWGQKRAYGLQTARRFPGVNVNRLAPTGPGSFDPLTGQAHLTGINVTVSQAQPGSA